MEKRCILFDADGVIIRSEMFGVKYQKENSISPEEMLPFYKGIFQDCLIGKADLKKVIKPWLKKWKWKGSVEDFIREWFNYENKPDQKIIDLIKDLRSQGIQCYLTTNQEAYRTRYMRKEMEFEKIFDGIFSSAEIGYKKPDSEFYNYVLQKLDQFDKSEILYTDDAPSYIEGAKKLGIPSFLYTELKDFKEYLKN